MHYWVKAKVWKYMCQTFLISYSSRCVLQLSCQLSYLAAATSCPPRQLFIVLLLIFTTQDLKEHVVIHMYVFISSF